MFNNSKYTFLFLGFILLAGIKNFLLGLHPSFLNDCISIGLDSLIFWLLVPGIKNRYWPIIISLSALGLKYVLRDFQLIGFDIENQILSTILAASPFLYYLIFQGNFRRFFVLIFMSFASNVNLSLGQNFIGNISLLNDLNVLSGIHFQKYLVYVDNIFLSTIKAVFLGSLVIIFYEFEHQFFTWKSWRFYVEQKTNKISLLIIFGIFKPLLYWFMGSIILTALGRQALPIFANKFSLAIYGFTFIIYFIIYAIYFRKFVSTYFYENFGVQNVAYLFLVLPVFDLLALLFLLVFKNFRISKLLAFTKPTKWALYALILLILGHMVYYYFYIFKSIDLNDTELGLYSKIILLAAPLVLIISLLCFSSKAHLYRMLIGLVAVLGVVLYLFVLPKLETKLDITHIITLYVHYILLILAIIYFYPFLFFTEYMGRNKI